MRGEARERYRREFDARRERFAVDGDVEEERAALQDVVRQRVRRIVTDIVRTHTQVTKLHKRLESASAAKDQQPLQTELEQSVDHLQEYVDELSQVGCELKDFPTGLVDFIGRHQGRDVCLCWRLGEDKIEYWHELQSGFAGRQTIAILEETD